MKFFLGTHQPHWLRKLDVPLFVSHRRLKDYKTLPKAQGPWALDSGGFTELQMYGRWETSVEEYVEAVQRYQQDVGMLSWASPMDWMCEPQMVARSGLSVYEHQRRTIHNFLALQDQGPFIPVLQGWAPKDYVMHGKMYHYAGVALERYPLVGVGSVCRRQGTDEIERIFRELKSRGLCLHGFGVKTQGLARYQDCLTSSDSMAWSYSARRAPALADCVGHKNCANCSVYALQWRERLLGGLTH